LVRIPIIYFPPRKGGVSSLTERGFVEDHSSQGTHMYDKVENILSPVAAL